MNFMTEKIANRKSMSPGKILAPGGEKPKSKVHHVKPGQAILGDRIIDENHDRKNKILTPGGPREKSQVHHVERDAYLETEKGRMVKKHKSGRILEQYGEVPSVHTSKHLALRDTIHHFNRLKVPGPNGGWVSSAQFTNAQGQNISQFECQWVVPPEPISQNGQLIYLFNGLLNSIKILQPVLQWGNNGDSGGNYWQVASWYAGMSSDDSSHSDYVRVNPGDLLTGVMTLIGNTNGGFDYDCRFVGIPGTEMTVRSQPEMFVSVATLEAYNISAPAEYPGADFTAFFNLNLQIESPLGGNENPATFWAPVNFPWARFGESTKIISDANAGGVVEIFYNDSPTGEFRPVYQQGDPGLGIGGYDLASEADRSFAFDYDSSGFNDHLVCYRPGSGAIFIMSNTGRNQTPTFPTPPLFTFTAVYAQGDQGNGIGGYDLKSTDDRAFAFDYNGNGKADHLVFYRPGQQVIFILANNGGNFQPALQSFNGIGGYDLKSTDDRIFAFDFNGSGIEDHLVLYRPGAGVLFILSNNGGNFQPVFQTFNGIGGYDLLSTDDKVFAFDFDGSGRADHLALYRPGGGVLFILKNNNGVFQPVFQSFNGVGNYDLLSADDLIFPFDFDRSGIADHLALYRPGTGTIWILQNNGAVFTAVYHQGDEGYGIGGYNLADTKDLLFAFDYDRSGRKDHICCYRPGHATYWILEKA